ncbi:unnamed protein product [Brassica rapa]|uniref:heme oxygenase (biliverdin-producing) n=1 Tax=Brassica campestris TaxID=3711 RepID=A0A3P5YG15_BRACM|nr:unnamed protein product [Brassica rapa]VDC59861.1 unnamed protein product [Brassica rapa]
MTTVRFTVTFRFPASPRLDCESYAGLKARTARVSYPLTIATRRHHLVQIANEDRTLLVKAAAGEIPNKRYPGEPKGFVEEMRSVAMKMHPRTQSKEGKRESKAPQDSPVATWEFTVEGYLKFLVENKLVFDTLEGIIHDSTVPTYAAFKNTGLERANNLAKDLEWFKEQGYELPEPKAHCKTYSLYLKDIAENDPPAFICHFYNIYFGHSAGGGRMIGSKVSERILDNKKLEFYKWDGDISELLTNLSEELNKVSELWTREEKNHCLEETEKAFKCYGHLLRSLVSPDL